MENTKIEPEDIEDIEKFAASALRMFTIDGIAARKIENGEEPNHELVVKFCFNLAEAMILERDKRYY